MNTTADQAGAGGASPEGPLNPAGPLKSPPLPGMTAVASLMEGEKTGLGARGAGYVILLAILAVATLIWGPDMKVLTLQGDAGQKALTSLGALMVVALFVERTQEVFVKAWRKLGRARLEDLLEHSRDVLNHIDRATDAAGYNAAYEQVRALQTGLAAYRAATVRVAFLTGLTLGVLVSLVGPRLLADVLGVAGTMEEWGPVQRHLFVIIDVFVTGGLIGGGSDGIHKLMSLITDFLDQTRAGMKGSA